MAATGRGVGTVTTWDFAAGSSPFQGGEPSPARQPRARPVAVYAAGQTQPLPTCSKAARRHERGRYRRRRRRRRLRCNPRPERRPPTPRGLRPPLPISVFAVGDSRNLGRPPQPRTAVSLVAAPHRPRPSMLRRAASPPPQPSWPRAPPPPPPAELRPRGAPPRASRCSVGERRLRREERRLERRTVGLVLQSRWSPRRGDCHAWAWCSSRMVFVGRRSSCTASTQQPTPLRLTSGCGAHARG